MYFGVFQVLIRSGHLTVKYSQSTNVLVKITREKYR